MVYIIYDNTSKKIIKTGLAADIAACQMQLDDPINHSCISADNSDAMTTQKTNLGLHD